MIYRLQRNFILVCTVSVLTVIAFVFALLSLFNISSMNRNLDILADNVFEGGGRFPDRFHETPPPHREEPSDREFDFITPETPFATRHFTVWFDESGAVTRVNTESIRSVTEEQAKVFANKAVAEGDDGGWISNYRYKLFRVGDGKSIVFIDGSMSRASMLQSLTTSALVLLGCAATVLLLVVLLSKRVVKPIAESSACTPLESALYAESVAKTSASVASLLSYSAANVAASRSFCRNARSMIASSIWLKLAPPLP